MGDLSNTADLERFRIADIHEYSHAIASGSRVLVFDTTLRDGEQTPGVALRTKQKQQIAEQLAKLGVDIIEAGFPASSMAELSAVQEIAETVGRRPRPRQEGELDAPPVIAGMARAHRRDIDRVWSSVQAAVRPRVHIVLATSDLHMEHKLGKSRPEVLEMAIESVKYARSLCDDVEFSPEDASRSDPAFLADVLEAVIAAGATTINLPDTVGYAVPEEFGSLVRMLRTGVSGADRVIFSAHCHDDLGLAAANTLAALACGARQAELTINGVGERAGNACLEEVVMALETRRAVYGLHTRIVTRELARSSNLVAESMGLLVQANKAIVGANAFSHEAGIHQDGMLKSRSTYEIISPESVGRGDGMQIVLGKHSGRNALRFKLESMGYELTTDQLAVVFGQFKQLVDQRSGLSDADVVALCASFGLPSSKQAMPRSADGI